MGDSITNFFELLTKGDFFLIFLIAMMVIIIGVIVYLVKLQISDAPDYDKKYRDYDDEEDEDHEEDYIVPKVKEKEPKEVLKPSYSNLKTLDSLEDEEVLEEPLKSPVMNFEPIKSVQDLEEDFEDIDNKVDNMISEGISYREDLDELISEPSITYKDEDFESPAHSKPRFIEQSRFDFENPVEEIERDFSDDITDNKLDIDETPAFLRDLEEEKDSFESIKSYEDEQEANAIISASELENRINELKASGEYEQHERQLQEYEQEQETKAIISYEELLQRASQGVVSYESEEELGGGIRVGKVDTSNIETYSETNEKPYYKEETFLEAMKEFRRAL